MNNLSLLTGVDLPFPEGRLIIHQPTIKEIGIIGEDNFFVGCGCLNFSKDILNDVDKKSLENIDDFNILMSIIIDTQGQTELRRSVECAKQVLCLLFPNLQIRFDKNRLYIGDNGFIDATNFIAFKNVLKEMFKLSFKNEKVQSEFKPANNAAAAIAEKLKKRHTTLTERSGNSGEVRFFGRYMSIVSVYSGISYIDLVNYTVYQLYDIFERVQLKQNYDFVIKAKLAGAKDIKDPEDWTKDLYKK